MTNQPLSGQDSSAWSVAGCFIWFLGGIALSLTSICSLFLLVMFAVSTALNVYLSWEMSGIEVVINRPVAPAVAAPPEPLVAVPAPLPPEALSTPTPAPTESPLITQLSTLAALATQVAQESARQEVALAQPGNPAVPPVAVEATPAAPLAAQPIVPDAAEAGAAFVPETNAPPAQTSPGQGGNQTALAVEAAAVDTSGLSNSTAVNPAPITSDNQYSLIPLEGGRDPRPAPEHADLNLMLRTPRRTESAEGLKFLELSGGTDPNAPTFNSILTPDFSAEYTLKNWDWGCNCPTDWIQSTAMMGLRTTPGDPIYIPKVDGGRDIFQGKYYAVLLYATEDMVTFAYSRDGTVAHSYAVHYLGLQTDPNLLALYRSSQGNELPGLTLDTPVGTATDELIVAIRDKGAFMDLRSKKDWWR
jgi:hypothetical protein